MKYFQVFYFLLIVSIILTGCRHAGVDKKEMQKDILIADRDSTVSPSDSRFRRTAL